MSNAKTDVSALIHDSVEALEAKLTEVEGTRAETRVRFVLLLKQGVSIEDARHQLAEDPEKPIGSTSANKWFTTYVTSDLESLCASKSSGRSGGGGGRGRASALTPEVMESVEAAITERGRIDKDDVHQILLDLGVEYSSPAGSFNAVNKKLQEDGRCLKATSVYSIETYVPRKRKTAEDAEEMAEMAPPVDEDAELEDLVDTDFDEDDDDDWDL